MCSFNKFGGRTGVRTQDLQVKSPLLYLLSYTSIVLVYSVYRAILRPNNGLSMTLSFASFHIVSLFNSVTITQIGFVVKPFFKLFLVPEDRIELSATALSARCSTTELLRHYTLLSILLPNWAGSMSLAALS